jgi:hypothetical protein
MQICSKASNASLVTQLVAATIPVHAQRLVLSVLVSADIKPF